MLLVLAMGTVTPTLALDNSHLHNLQDDHE